MRPLHFNPCVYVVTAEHNGKGTDTIARASFLFCGRVAPEFTLVNGGTEVAVIWDRLVIRTPTEQIPER
jgi:hypothetical protein